MQELRQDPVVGRWVIVAPNRAARPRDFCPAETIRPDGPCPFCEGLEDITTPELYAVRRSGTKPNAPGWQVRVIPNKYPALTPDGEPSEKRRGMYRSLSGVGAHEVIIESPGHLSRLTELSPAELAHVFAAYRQRLLALRADDRLAHILIFKNSGAGAGASLEHLHSQLIGTPIVPIHIQEELAGARRFWEPSDECVYCRMLAEELADGRRIVWESPDFAAFCPFASRFPHEVWILPKRHASRFEDADDRILASVAGMVWRVVGGLENALDRPAYNYMMHTAPLRASSDSYYHWRLEIIPRTVNLAGFEWGTGFCINPVSPEDAASQLREAVVRTTKVIE